MYSCFSRMKEVLMNLSSVFVEGNLDAWSADRCRVKD